MDEGGASGESGTGLREGPVQLEREEDPFDLDQFLETAAGWRSTSGEFGSGSSCSGGDGVDMNM